MCVYVNVHMYVRAHICTYIPDHYQHSLCNSHFLLLHIPVELNVRTVQNGKIQFLMLLLNPDQPKIPKFNHIR